MRTLTEARRQLLWHGMLLFLCGLLNGVVVQHLANPRMALSAHLDAVTSGTFLIAAGLVWRDLRLGARAAALARWLLIYGMYAIWVALLLAALFGAHGMLPIAGAGQAAGPWQERLVVFGVLSGSATLIASCALLLFGLRGRTATDSAAP